MTKRAAKTASNPTEGHLYHVRALVGDVPAFAEKRISVVGLLSHGTGRDSHLVLLDLLDGLELKTEPRFVRLHDTGSAWKEIASGGRQPGHRVTRLAVAKGRLLNRPSLPFVVEELSVCAHGWHEAV